MAIHKLGKSDISNATKPLCDGAGLWLVADATGPRSWAFRFMLAGRSREMGLGSARVYTVTEARAMANDARKLLDRGVDPIEERKRQEAAAATARAAQKTFAECATDYLKVKSPEWKNAKHKWQWRATMDRYVIPKLGPLFVRDINTPLVKSVIEPIWLTKTETARRTLDRVEAVLDFAISGELRGGPNPARWKGHMEHQFPKRSAIAPVRHHPALPYGRLHGFMTELRKRDGIASRALEFVILTGSRTGPVRLATWGEVSGAVWTIPVTHMKGKKGQEKEFKVPLSKPALALLAALGRGRDGDLIFPSVGDAPLSNMGMLQVCRRLDFKDEAGEVVVPHGFRSSLKQWCREVARVEEIVSEAILAHAEDGKVMQAYGRQSDMLDRRASVMEMWATYIDTPPETPAANVIELRAVS